MAVGSNSHAANIELFVLELTQHGSGLGEQRLSSIPNSVFGRPSRASRTVGSLQGACGIPYGPLRDQPDDKAERGSVGRNAQDETEDPIHASFSRIETALGYFDSVRR